MTGLMMVFIGDPSPASSRPRTEQWKKQDLKRYGMKGDIYGTLFFNTMEYTAIFWDIMCLNQTFLGTEVCFS